MKMRKIKGCRIALVEKISIALLALTLCICAVLGFYDFLIPETVSCFSGEAYPSYLGATLEVADADSEAIISLSTGQYKLFGSIPIKEVTAASVKDMKVLVGGVPFGIKFFTKGVLVVGFDDENSNPAFAAGLRLHDIITQINEKNVNGINQINEIIENCNGHAVKITYLRGGKERSLTFTPKYSESDKKYTCGIWLKDSGAGIGTVTYVLEDGSFGGLGHGICDGDTGELIAMERGTVAGVSINGVVRGQSGAPGELKGYFNSTQSGVLLKNTERGVFGILREIPEAVKNKPVSIGLKGDLKEGKATVICTVGEGERCEYEIEISNINQSATGNKCFSIKVTDDRLLSITGGIVQGMSGSPIIQNGKLVGAVTHVLINDPTTGYGIFIENMLNAENTKVMPKAA